MDTEIFYKKRENNQFEIHNLLIMKHLSLKRPRGGGYLTKFNTGRLRPEVQPLTLLYTILAEKELLLYSFY